MAMIVVAAPFVINSVSYSALSFSIMSLVLLVIGLVMIAHRTHEFIYQGADRVISCLGFGVSPLGTTQGLGEIEGRVMRALKK